MIGFISVSGCLGKDYEVKSGLSSDRGCLGSRVKGRAMEWDAMCLVRSQQFSESLSPTPYAPVLYLFAYNVYLVLSKILLSIMMSLCTKKMFPVPLVT